jgi:hypothetical protein
VKVNPIKKAKAIVTDELRPEYKRSDFGLMTRGKYIERLEESSNVVIIDPEVSEWWRSTMLCGRWRRLPSMLIRGGGEASRF